MISPGKRMTVIGETTPLKDPQAEMQGEAR